MTVTKTHVTKTWKVSTPNISKKLPTARYDWSNRQSGTRIFEVFNKDTTGHNYSIVRITRDTAALCDEELAGQIRNGYFKGSPWVGVHEFKSRYYPQISVSLVRNLFGKVSETLNELEETIRTHTMDADEMERYDHCMKKYIETFNAIANKDERKSLKEHFDAIDYHNASENQFFELFEAVADAYYDWLDKRQATVRREDFFNSHRNAGITEEPSNNDARPMTM